MEHLDRRSGADDSGVVGGTGGAVSPIAEEWPQSLPPRENDPLQLVDERRCLRGPRRDLLSVLLEDPEEMAIDIVPEGVGA
jgi:hypothetical protein